MGDSKLKMYDDKIELMATGARSNLSQGIPNLAIMPLSQGIPNLAPMSLVVTCHSLNLLETPWMHILNTCAAFCSVSCADLKEIRSFLSTDATYKLAVSLILSKSDYCNILLVGISDNKRNKFQSIQNHAALLPLQA